MWKSNGLGSVTSASETGRAQGAARSLRMPTVDGSHTPKSSSARGKAKAKRADEESSRERLHVLPLPQRTAPALVQEHTASPRIGDCLVAGDSCSSCTRCPICPTPIAFISDEFGPRSGHQRITTDVFPFIGTTTIVPKIFTRGRHITQGSACTESCACTWRSAYSCIRLVSAPAT